MDEFVESIYELAHPTRIEVVKKLAQGGEVNVADLHDQCAEGVSQSNLSQHLQRLRRVGLVESRRDSQKVYYRINEELLQRVTEAFLDITNQAPVDLDEEAEGDVA